MTLGREVADWSEVAVAMDRGLRVFAELAKPVLAEHGAESLSMTNLMFLLSVGGGDARVNEVVRKGRYLGSNASYALKALQDGGYIGRRQDPEDRRNAIVSWTERGRALAGAVSAACRSGGSEAVAALEAIREFEAHCARLAERGA